MSSKGSASPRRRQGRRALIPPSRRKQYLAFLIVLVALTYLGWKAHSMYESVLAYPDRQGERSAAEQTILTIPSGSGLDKVLDLMVKEEVLAGDERKHFKLYVLHKGASRKITAGQHEFRGNMTPAEILEELIRRQKVEEIRVTIPEGKNSLQIAEILASKGLSSQAELESSMRSPELLKKYQVSGDSFEGYLFPDTYKFRSSANGDEIIERLVGRHREVYNKLRRKYRESAKSLLQDLDWGDEEILTLASIVEKETGAKGERPLIAGVFLNRLRFNSFKPKYLQTDPTIIYGCTVPKKKSEACEQFEGRIRRIHLRDKENPYNTYTHEYLPPGPISNPGKASMEAVLSPKRSRYLYFVARNDGTHYFSSTRAEHERAVDKYIRGGAVGDGKVQQ